MKRMLLVLLVLAVVAVAAWLLSHRPSAPPLVSGTIEVDEAHVASRYGGRVIKLHAQEGDLLTPGSLIAELDAAELRARRDYLAALLAELEAGPRTNEIAAARHEWESLAAQLVSAQADARRARELFSEKTISESEMQNLVSHADALSESVTASKKRHDLLVEGTRPERIAQARAQLAEIGAQLSEMQITAPLEGKPPGEPQSARNATARQEPRPPSYTLETLSVKVGDVLPPNREVATLLFTGHLWVRVYVPEPWLAQIEVGQKVIVRADGTDRQFEGVVEQINRRAEFTPRNVQTVEDRVRQVFGIKIRLPTDTLLKAGMSVDVRFPKLP